jgi:thiol-disulfide isomerase/thioredoxin
VSKWSGVLEYLRASWARLAAALAVFAAVGVFALLLSGSAEEPGESGRPSVRVLRGGVQTVYHSTAPLPTAASPQPDSLGTLIWFSATWCTTCASMDSFAQDVLDSFNTRLVIVEKSIDHDKDSANRYAIRATPTFLLIDASGREVARFNYVGSADALRQKIEQAVAQL